MKTVKPLFSIALLSLILFACRSSPESSGTEDSAYDSIEATEKYQFLKIYHTAIGDTTYTDSTILRLTVDEAAKVSGTYLWVLPGKDGKYGSITGRLSNDTVYGRYAYQQEGGNYNDSIRIVLRPDGAIVSQFSSSNYELRDTLQ